MPNTLDISEARKQLNTLDQRLRETPVITVTRYNKDAFVAVDVEFFSSIMETLEILADPETLEMLQRSLEDISKGRLHDHENVKRELL